MYNLYIVTAYLEPEDERLLDEESTSFGDQKRYVRTDHFVYPKQCCAKINPIILQQFSYSYLHSDLLKIIINKNFFIVVMECQLYTNIRKQRLPAFYWRRPDMFKFTELFNTDVIRILKNLSIYVKDIF